MSRTPITRVGAAAIGLLSLPATAVTSYQIVVADPNAAAIIATSATPFARGRAYGGSSAGSTLVTSHAQTAVSDGFASGYAASSAVVRSTLDLTGITAHRVTLRYALQVGGIDAIYGSALVLSVWLLGYTNGAIHLVALVGERAIDTSGVAIQGVYRYDGSANPGCKSAIAITGASPTMVRSTRSPRPRRRSSRRASATSPKRSRRAGIVRSPSVSGSRRARLSNPPARA